jgi:hypothetical protein
MEKEYRQATAAEIELAKQWVLANTPVHPKDFDPTADPEYARALEIMIFANGGRYVDPDPMPVFVIKGKDRLAPEAVAAYGDLCACADLLDQASEVEAALAEINDWQRRHPDMVETPDHQHIPATTRS